MITPIEDVLHKGQEILVQVSKESLGTKGARITSFISLPGRYLVYMPQVNHLGVSRRIHDADERDRLRQLVRGLRPPGGGFIVRTVGEGRARRSSAPTSSSSCGSGSRSRRGSPRRRRARPLHEEGDLVFRVVRDLFAADIEEIVIDGEEEYRRARRVRRSAGARPRRTGSISTPSGSRSSRRAASRRRSRRRVRRRVWLKSGGYLVIDHTEALVSIDVNTGQVRRQARPRGDDPQDQPRGGGRDRAADPPARPGRHHHHRLHRHGARGAPGPGVPRAEARAGRRQVRGRMCSRSPSSASWR